MTNPSEVATLRASHARAAARSGSAASTPGARRLTPSASTISRPWVPANQIPRSTPSMRRTSAISRPLIIATLIRAGSRARALSTSPTPLRGRASAGWGTISESVPSKSRQRSREPRARVAVSNPRGMCAGCSVGGKLGGGLLKRASSDERLEEGGRPRFQVVSSQLGAQRAHSRDLLLGRHLERLLDPRRDLIDVVWIHEQRVGHFLGRSSEFTQDQYPIIVGAGRDVFLGDQVHPVAQGGQQRHVAGLVVGHQLLGFELRVEIANRHPSFRRKASDDAADLLVDLALQLGIVANPGARRYRYE